MSSVTSSLSFTSVSAVKDVVNYSNCYVCLLIILLLTIAILYLIRSKVRNEKLLRLQNLELKKLNATKDKFFSIIAHDLKSPFNSLLGFSEMLSLQVEDQNTEEVVKASKIIYSSTRKLYSLVDTLLQWSRTQLGNIDYKPEKLDIKIEISNILSVLKLSAEEKDILLTLNEEGDGYISAWADKDLFSAVLRNLLINAIKFSRLGSDIKVTLRKGKKNIAVSIRDNGVGMGPGVLKNLFRIDSNISTSGTLDEKGTGLGLVLCKEFVELNKGEIMVESYVNKGSKFTFTVPIYKEDY